MPTSRCDHIPTIIFLVRALAPSSILDVGVGFGKWGHLFREYTDIMQSENEHARYRKENWRVTIDGVEGFPEYLTPAHDYLYDRIHIGDMRAVVPALGMYDLIFLGDVIEHVEKQDGFRLLATCLEHANKAVLVSTPAKSIEQGSACGNPLEIHRSSWTARDFETFGNARTTVTDNDILVAVILRPGVKPVKFRRRPRPSLLRRAVRKLKRTFLPQKSPSSDFPGSTKYWEQRYLDGLSSGLGSYGVLAEYKADFINRFVREHGTHTVFELGCGDGNQLSQFDIRRYIGADVSATVIAGLRQRFEADGSKTFLHTSDLDGQQRAELSLSLDVIYHLVEDTEFAQYMRQLFESSSRYVIVYSSDEDRPQETPHVRDRNFTRYVASFFPEFKLVDHEANPFRAESRADFFVYERVQP